jgi:hypothetical protein
MKKGAAPDPEGEVPHVTCRACVLGRFVLADLPLVATANGPEQRPFDGTLTIAPDAHTSTPPDGRGPLAGPNGAPVRRTVRFPNSTMIQLGWRSTGGGLRAVSQGVRVSSLPATDVWPRGCAR